jgi:hypothetical protein
MRDELSDLMNDRFWSHGLTFDIVISWIVKQNMFKVLVYSARALFSGLKINFLPSFLKNNQIDPNNIELKDFENNLFILSLIMNNCQMILKRQSLINV